MHLVLMVLVLLTDSGPVRVMAKAYPDAAACEAAKADVSAQAVAAGVQSLGLACVDVPVGSPS